jgi:hypothetical protein
MSCCRTFAPRAAPPRPPSWPLRSCVAYSSLSGLPRMSSRSEASWTSGRKASMGIWFAKRYTESSRLTSAGNPSRDGAASSAFTSHAPASTCALDTSPSVISLRTFTGSTGFSRKSRTTGQRAASTASPITRCSAASGSMSSSCGSLSSSITALSGSWHTGSSTIRLPHLFFRSSFDPGPSTR